MGKLVNRRKFIFNFETECRRMMYERKWRIRITNDETRNAHDLNATKRSTDLVATWIKNDLQFEDLCHISTSEMMLRFIFAPSS